MRKHVGSRVWEIKQDLILRCTKETLKAKFNDKYPNLLSSTQYDEVLAQEVWNLEQTYRETKAYRETGLCRTCFNCRLYGVVSKILVLLIQPSVSQESLFYNKDRALVIKR